MYNRSVTSSPTNQHYTAFNDSNFLDAARIGTGSGRTEVSTDKRGVFEKQSTHKTGNDYSDSYNYRDSD